MNFLLFAVGIVTAFACVFALEMMEQKRKEWGE